MYEAPNPIADRNDCIQVIFCLKFDVLKHYLYSVLSNLQLSPTRIVLANT